MTPTLSIVMPAYNVAAYVGEAIGSLRAQTFQSLELIVVDDGSADETGARVETLAAEAGRGGFVIRLVRQTNQGPAAARNAGLALAQGRYIGFLDADDRWAPEKAERHVAALEARGDIDLTFSWFKFVNEDGSETNQTYCPNVRVLSFNRLLRKNIIHTGTVVARREALSKAGGFDPAFRTFEDFDLWLRIAALRPDNICCLREVLTDYRRREGQLTGDWRDMNAGWERVVAKQNSLHPISSDAERDARGNHLQYCSALAFNAGDHAEARRLIARAWAQSGARFLARPECLLMTAICICTLLPRPVQIALGDGYGKIRALREAVRKRFARRNAARAQPNAANS